MFRKTVLTSDIIKESDIGIGVEYLCENCENERQPGDKKEGHPQAMSFRRKYLTIFVLLLLRLLRE